MKYKYLIFTLFCFLTVVSCNKPLEPEKPDDKDKKEEQKKEEEPVNADPYAVKEHHFVMGSILAFQKDHRTGKSSASNSTSSSTLYNLSLVDLYNFESTDDDWWNSIVEQYEYAGLDFVMPNCRGRLAKADTDPKYEMDHGDPTKLKGLLEALERRGSDLKVAIFDDCPASWAAARNKDLYNSYTSVIGSAAKDAYPINDLDAFYKYVWDYNIKLAFANFYGENQKYNKYLLRVGGKPFLMIWSPNGFLNKEYGGVKPDASKCLKAVIDQLHKDFKETFGEEVHICVDRAFADRDSYCDKSVIDSMNDWFSTSSTSSTFARSTHTLNGTTVSVAVPGFSVNDKTSSPMFIDPRDGKRLIESLDEFVRYKSDVVVLEGFSDIPENAAYWRSTDKVYYKYPNQRLNICRRYNSTKAYPMKMRVEAEGCDYYEDKTKGNSGKQYRQGDLDVARTTDTCDGWCVTNTEAGEWIKWAELPYRACKSTLKLRYRSDKDAVVRFDIGGKQGVEKALPATGTEWKDIDAAEVAYEITGWHETILNIISGSPEINYFDIVASE